MSTPLGNLKLIFCHSPLILDCLGGFFWWWWTKCRERNFFWRGIKCTMWWNNFWNCIFIQHSAQFPVELQGIPPFRDFTIREPRYFVVLFQASFHDFEEKKIIFCFVFQKKNLIFFFFLIVFLFIYSDGHQVNIGFPC